MISTTLLSKGLCFFDIMLLNRKKDIKYAQKTGADICINVMNIYQPVDI